MAISPEIDEYMGNLPLNWQKDFIHLREIIQEIYPKINEVVKNKFVYFKINNISMFIFGQQKQNMAFYISKALLKIHKDGLEGLNLGKGTIRFNDISKINEKILKSIIKGAETLPFEFSKRGDSTR